MPRFVRQLGNLLGRRNVAGEKRNPSEIELARERSQLWWNALPIEASDEQLSDVSANVTD